MSNKNKPVHRLHLSTISAAIFRNVSEEGYVRYNATFDRSYKDGDQWKHVDSYGRDDLLNLSKLADQANTWIHEQEHADRQGPEASAEPN